MPRDKRTRRGKLDRTGERRFEFRGWWLDLRDDDEDLSGYWYAFRYSTGTGRVRRTSLGTRDRDKAQIELIAECLKDGNRDPQTPDKVHLSLVFTYYQKKKTVVENGKKKKKPHPAAILGHKLCVEFMRENGTSVADFSGEAQKKFIASLSGKHETSSIVSYMKMIAAAVNMVLKDSKDTKLEGVPRLKSAPHIITGENEITAITDRPAARPREYLPSFKDMAKFIDHIKTPHVRRYVIIGLNTWARPEAVCDLSKSQVNYELGLIDLNPEDRRQAVSKWRALIPISSTLLPWLEQWDAERKTGEPEQYVFWRGEPIKSAAGAFQRVREKKKVNLPQLIPYTLRHFMRTHAEREGALFEDAERFMGHAVGNKSTSSYLHYHKNYLRSAREATERIIRELDKHTKTNLLPNSSPMPISLDNERRKRLRNND